MAQSASCCAISHGTKSPRPCRRVQTSCAAKKEQRTRTRARSFVGSAAHRRICGCRHACLHACLRLCVRPQEGRGGSLTLQAARCCARGTTHIRTARAAIRPQPRCSPAISAIIGGTSAGGATDRSAWTRRCDEMRLCPVAGLPTGPLCTLQTGQAAPNEGFRADMQQQRRGGAP
jgi:hypothetical protein